MTSQATNAAERAVPLDREVVAALAATARRVGTLEACLFFRREGSALIEIPAEDEGLRLPLSESFTGACLAAARAQTAHLGQELLHPRERSVLRSFGAESWLAVPIVPVREALPIAVAVGLSAQPLEQAAEQQLAALSLVAEQYALRLELVSLRAAVAAERSRTRELEGEAEGILHSLRAAALVLSAEHNLLNANRSAETLLGFQLTEARGRPLVQVLDNHELAKALLAVRSSAGPPLEVRLDGGTRAVLEVHVTPVYDVRGALSCRVVVLNDTTLLRQADELKSEFISMVSHELRTPLTSIKAFASTLLRVGDAGRPEDSREWLQIIDHECDRLTALINDLLAISQLDSGKPLSMDYGEFDLMTLLRDASEAQLASSHKHELLVSGPERLELAADEAKLRQVVNNLLSNAVKYSPRGGTVHALAEAVGDEVRLQVQDQGVGIRPEHLNLVFEKFFQVDGSTTRRVGGSGLGLYLTKRLVEAHHGQIWAESELGVGSTFVVTLPRCRAQAAEAGA